MKSVATYQPYLTIPTGQVSQIRSLLCSTGPLLHLFRYRWGHCARWKSTSWEMDRFSSSDGVPIAPEPATSLEDCPEKCAFQDCAHSPCCIWASHEAQKTETVQHRLKPESATSMPAARCRGQPPTAMTTVRWTKTHPTFWPALWTSFLPQCWTSHGWKMRRWFPGIWQRPISTPALTTLSTCSWTWGLIKRLSNLWCKQGVVYSAPWKSRKTDSAVGKAKLLRTEQTVPIKPSCLLHDWFCFSQLKKGIKGTTPKVCSVSFRGMVGHFNVLELEMSPLKLQAHSIQNIARTKSRLSIFSLEYSLLLPLSLLWNMSDFSQDLARYHPLIWSWSGLHKHWKMGLTDIVKDVESFYYWKHLWWKSGSGWDQGMFMRIHAGKSSRNHQA